MMINRLSKLIETGMNIRTLEELNTWIEKLDDFNLLYGLDLASYTNVMKSAMSESERMILGSYLTSTYWLLMNKLFEISKITLKDAMDMLKSDDTDTASPEYVIAKCEVMAAADLQLPVKVVVKQWCPSVCPRCGHELFSSCRDGYYTHSTHITACPNCGKKLQW